jgi:hypothetical protein
MQCDNLEKYDKLHCPLLSLKECKAVLLKYLEQYRFNDIYIIYCFRHKYVSKK